MSFVTYDIKCPECEYVKEEMFDISMEATMEEIDSIVNNSIECPNCGDCLMRRAFITPPSGKVDKGYAHNISKMKESFHQRFMKPESQDQMRHQHGNLYDASLRGGALDKAEKMAEKAFVKTDGNSDE